MRPHRAKTGLPRRRARTDPCRRAVNGFIAQQLQIRESHTRAQPTAVRPAPCARGDVSGDFYTGDSRVLCEFAKRLPRRPYATDDLDFGVHILPRKSAITKAYLQIGSSTVRGYVPQDLDYEGAGAAWLDAEIPRPTIIAINRENGHAHAMWELAVPVRVEPFRRSARFYDAVERGLAHRLRADRGYAGMLVKNPFSPRWAVHIYDRAYSLWELFQYLDQDDIAYRPVLLSDVGRNCAIFDAVRSWAYARVAGFTDERQWAEAVNAKVVATRSTFVNARGETLEYRELGSISKSVARWVWARRDQFTAGYHTPNRGALGFHSLPPMDIVARAAAIRQRRALAGIATATGRRKESVARIGAARARLTERGDRVTNAALATEAKLHRNTVAAVLRNSRDGA